MKKPNILFLFADDMRFSTIGYLGNPDIKTPNLDELARRGTSFTNAHFPGGTVAAVCMPSRAMLQTGRCLFHLRDSGADIPKEHTMLGETLQQAGYRTFGTGKWHNGYASYARSFTDGAEIYFGGMYDHWKVPVYTYDPTGKYPNVVNDVMSPWYDNFNLPKRCDHVTLGKHSSDLFAEAACNFIEGYHDEKPFYMFVSYLAPHDPRTMPQEFLDQYNIDDIKLPPNFMPEHPFDFGIKDVRDERLTATPRSEKEIKRHIREYYAMVSHLDATVGRIVDSLKNAGKYDDTIILFSADNGLAVGQHGLMGKQSCYEHSIKVPLIFSGPGIPKDERRDSFVYLMDIFPTLCQFARTEIPASVEGIGFKQIIEGDGADTRDVIFSTYGDKVRSIKNHKYKLIEYKCGNLRKTQLFDLENDPHEMDDLRKNIELQPVIKKLHADLVDYAKSWDDMASAEGARFWEDYMDVEPDPLGV